MTLLKFTQKMYLLVNVKPHDDLKVQILWLNMCPTSWSISTRNLWWVKWLVMFNFRLLFPFSQFCGSLQLRSF
jgi:hypothetical protein